MRSTTASSTDEVLLPLYPEQPDLTGARHRLTLFLAQYWGGPTTYMEERGHPRLRMRHFPFHVGPLERDRWLVHMAAAVEHDVCRVARSRRRRRRADGVLRPGGRASAQRHGPAHLHVAHQRIGSSGMPVIDVRDLRKSYGAVSAVDGLSFHVDAGEVYALLGENGAGKSTAVEILEGHRTATSGAVEVLGVDPAGAGRDFRDRIGIVLQSSGVEAEFTVREVIELYGGCYRTPRPLDEVVGLVGLDEKVDARIGSLSGGQRRRVDLALGIVGRPELLFLDEPTTGFDPAARRQSWDLIEALGDDGTTVLLTTHYLDEAEHLADRVGVLSQGRMIAEGTPEQLIGQVSGTVVSFMLPESDPGRRRRDHVRHLLGVDIRLSGRLVEANVDHPTAAVHRLTGWAIDAGVELESLSVSRASLEDVYLALLGHRRCDGE